MTSSGDRHVPRAEFVAALEEEVRRAYRATPTGGLLREATEQLATQQLTTQHLATPRPLRRGGRLLRQAAVLALGLALGVGATMASAQVQDSRARGEIEMGVALARDVRAMRLRVAREALQQAQQSYAAGAISKEALLAAESEVRVNELAIAKLEIELQEVRATSRAARSELWAPTVNGRDFVAERLRMDAAAAQERIKLVEMQAAQADKEVALGAKVMREAVETERELVAARREWELQAMRVSLREEAVAKSLGAEEVGRRLQRLELTIEVRAARQRVELASARYTVVVERVKAGAATKLEEKRAELELLESEAALQQVTRDLLRLGRPEGE